MKKDFKSFLKTYMNVFPCPNCGQECESRYGIMNCPHCGKSYSVKIRFESHVVNILMGMGLMQYYMYSDLFNGSMFWKSLVMLLHFVANSLLVNFMMYRFMSGGLFVMKEIEEDVNDTGAKE
jgi:predicted RNA-binding Zn-ribbon protein involved in translation (DUF1610 family)